MRELITTVQVTDPRMSINDAIRKFLIKTKRDYLNTMNGDIYALFEGVYTKLLAVWKYGNEYSLYVCLDQVMA